MSDLLKSYAQNLRQIQFLILGLSAALFLAAIEGQSKLDRTSQELETLTEVALLLTTADPSVEQAFRNQINGHFSDGSEKYDYISDLKEQLATEFHHLRYAPVAKPEEKFLLDWRLDPYVLVDNDFLSDGIERQRYVRQSGTYPRNAPKCGLSLQRRVNGEAFAHRAPELRQQRHMPIPPITWNLFWDAARNVNRDEKYDRRTREMRNTALRNPLASGLGSRITLRQMQESWDLLDRGQIWVIDRDKLSDVSRSVGKSFGNETITLRLTAADGKPIPTTVDCAAPNQAQPPILSAFMPNDNVGGAQRVTEILVSYSPDMDRARSALLRELWTRNERFHFGFPAFAVESRGVQGELLMAVGASNPHALGTFDKSFPNLHQTFGDFMQYPLPLLSDTLVLMRDSQKSAFSFLGFSFPKSQIQLFGSLLLFATMTYFYASLLGLNREIRRSGSIPEVAWLPLQNSALSWIMTAIMIGGVPVMACTFGLLQGWNRAGITASDAGIWMQFAILTGITGVIILIVFAFRDMSKSLNKI